jgi:hypothetical protein
VALPRVVDRSVCMNPARIFWTSAAWAPYVVLASIAVGVLL